MSQNIFSADSQAKFSRLLKPVEFERKAKESTSDPTDDPQTVGEKKPPVSEEDKKEKESRTLFIGNMSTQMTVKEIKRFCSKYGDVESVRLRSIPILGTAVDDAGNQDLVRKVCAIKRKFGDQKGSMNAYVVFTEADSVGKALEANGTVIHSRHLRFDRTVPSVLEPRRTVFIGSLPHYVDEEALREHFASVSCITHVFRAVIILKKTLFQCVGSP